MKRTLLSWFTQHCVSQRHAELFFARLVAAHERINFQVPRNVSFARNDFCKNRRREAEKATVALDLI